MKDYYLKNNDKFILKTKDWNKNNPEKVKQNQKNIMNKTKTKETYILKTNENQMLNFV